VVLLSAPILNAGDSFTFSSLTSLFHELGHGLHSLLSRTEFQHASGTRGPSDLVEVPSTLMEFLARDYRVMRHVMRDASSGEEIPKAQFEQLVRSASRWDALEELEQVSQALLDAQVHGPNPPGSSAELLDVAHQCAAETLPLAPAHGEHRFTGYVHLGMYGGSYYSYPLARVLARALWERVLSHDPLDRAAGDHIRREFLQYGTSVEPRVVLSRVLGVPQLPLESLAEEMAASLRRRG
jgi:intermediate peptidase